MLSQARPPPIRPGSAVAGRGWGTATVGLSAGGRSAIVAVGSIRRDDAMQSNMRPATADRPPKAAEFDPDANDKPLQPRVQLPTPEQVYTIRPRSAQVTQAKVDAVMISKTRETATLTRQSQSRPAGTLPYPEADKFLSGPDFRESEQEVSGSAEPRFRFVPFQSAASTTASRRTLSASLGLGIHPPPAQARPRTAGQFPTSSASLSSSSGTGTAGFAGASGVYRPVGDGSDVNGSQRSLRGVSARPASAAMASLGEETGDYEFALFEGSEDGDYGAADDDAADVDVKAALGLRPSPWGSVQKSESGSSVSAPTASTTGSSLPIPEPGLRNGLSSTAASAVAAPRVRSQTSPIKSSSASLANEAAALAAVPPSYAVVALAPPGGGRKTYVITDPASTAGLDTRVNEALRGKVAELRTLRTLLQMRATAARQAKARTGHTIEDVERFMVQVRGAVLEAARRIQLRDRAQSQWNGSVGDRGSSGVSSHSESSASSSSSSSASLSSSASASAAGPTGAGHRPRRVEARSGKGGSGYVGYDPTTDLTDDSGGAGVEHRGKRGANRGNSANGGGVGTLEMDLALDTELNDLQRMGAGLERLVDYGQLLQRGFDELASRLLAHCRRVAAALKVDRLCLDLVWDDHAEKDEDEDFDERHYQRRNRPAGPAPSESAALTAMREAEAEDRARRRVSASGAGGASEEARNDDLLEGASLKLIFTNEAKLRRRLALYARYASEVLEREAARAKELDRSSKVFLRRALTQSKLALDEIKQEVLANRNRLPLLAAREGNLRTSLVSHLRPLEVCRRRYELRRTRPAHAYEGPDEVAARLEEELALLQAKVDALETDLRLVREDVEGVSALDAELSLHAEAEAMRVRMFSSFLTVDHGYGRGTVTVTTSGGGGDVGAGPRRGSGTISSSLGEAGQSTAATATARALQEAGVKPEDVLPTAILSSSFFRLRPGAELTRLEGSAEGSSETLGVRVTDLLGIGPFEGQVAALQAQRRADAIRLAGLRERVRARSSAAAASASGSSVSSSRTGHQLISVRPFSTTSKDDPAPYSSSKLHALEPSAEGRLNWLEAQGSNRVTEEWTCRLAIVKARGPGASLPFH